MKQYTITVNGNTYDVQVEESTTTATPVAAPVQAPVAKSTPVVAPTPKAASPALSAAPAGAKQIKSPMPGTIVKVNVKVGDTVKSGTLLCILEAMKMENEIFASSDGKVAAISVSQGATVNTGDVLVSIA